MLRLRYCQSENTFLQQAHKRRHRSGGGGGRSDAQQEVGESSYFTKGVVSSRDLGVGINVLQIPGEGFAVQGVAEAFAGGNVAVVHPHYTCRQDPNTVLTVKTSALILFQRPFKKKYAMGTEPEPVLSVNRSAN